MKPEHSMRNMFTALLVVIAMTATMSAQDATYRYKDGKEYKYLIEETGLTIQEVPGRTDNINTESTITSVLTLLEKLDNGHQRLQMTIESALVISENPRETNTFGGDAAGKSVSYEIDNTGDLVDVDTTIRDMDNESRSILMGAANVLPSFDAARIDDEEWTVEEVDTTGEGESQIIRESETTYQVKGMKEVNGYNCHEISIETETESDGKLVRGDQEMMLSGTQEGKGTVYYSAEKGLLIKMEFEVNGDQTIMFPSNNMRIPVTSNQVAKVELLGE